MRVCKTINKPRQIVQYVLIVVVLATGGSFVLAQRDGREAVNYVTQAGGVSLKVTGVKGLYLKIYNSPRFNTLADIHSYINVRRGQLTKLANAHPDREIDVSVSPAEKLYLSDFGSILRQHQLALEELSLDVFVDDKWDRTVGFDKTSVLMTLSDNPHKLAQRVLEIESSRPALPGAGDALPPGRTALGVRHARARGRAIAAARLQSEPGILLVDPVADIEDAFKTEAGTITVVTMPQLYVEKELRFGRLYAPENRRQVPPPEAR